MRCAPSAASLLLPDVALLLAALQLGAGICPERLQPKPRKEPQNAAESCQDRRACEHRFSIGTQGAENAASRLSNKKK